MEEPPNTAGSKVCLLWFPETVLQIYFSKMGLVLENSYPVLGESAQSLSGSHPDGLSSSTIVCPSLGQFPEG